MKLELWNSYRIGEHYACYIEYGDIEGLEPAEWKAYDGWRAGLPSGSSVHVGAGRDEFCRCDITGLYGACVNVDVYHVAP